MITVGLQGLVKELNSINRGNLLKTFVTKRAGAGKALR